MNHKIKPSANKYTTRGSTLIEVLISMLILSIGLLGVAKLQAASMRFSVGSNARAAVAVNLSDFADRMHANPEGDDHAYLFSDTYAAQRSAIAASTVVPAKDCGDANTTCTTDELAAFDLIQLRLALNANMPGSALYIEGCKSEGYVATVMWMDKSYLKDETSKTTQLSKADTCTGTETGIAARTCCPVDAQAPSGVRCTTMTIVP
jgi:type IV pilus assembly protein PilV